MRKRQPSAVDDEERQAFTTQTTGQAQRSHPERAVRINSGIADARDRIARLQAAQ